LLFAFSRSYWYWSDHNGSTAIFKRTSAIEESYIVMHTSSNQKNKMWNTPCWNSFPVSFLKNQKNI
jgi:hypothetical protein